MTRFKVKLYIIFAFVILLSLAVAGLGCYFLSDGFVKKQLGNSYTSLVNGISEEINLNTSAEYKTICNFIDDLNSDLTLSEKMAKVKNAKLLHSYNAGYVSDNKYYINGKSFDIDKKASSILINRSVSFYKLSDILVDYTEDDIYIVYKYNDIIVFYKSFDLLDNICNSVKELEQGNYFIIDKYGNVLYKENSNYSKKVIYEEFILGKDFNYDYELVSNDLLNNQSGFGKFETNGVESYLSYSPIILNEDDYQFYVCYKLIYDDELLPTQYVNAKKYLTTVMLICFASFVLIFNVSFYVMLKSYFNKEYNFSLSRVSQYYIKPFTIALNKKGKITLKNKSFKTFVLDADKYETIFDFNLFEEDGNEDVMEMIVKQKTFTLLLKDLKHDDLYIHVIPYRFNNRYTLIGEDITSKVLDSLTNRSIALYNKVTRYPNKYILDKDLKHLITTNKIAEKKYSLIAVDVSDFAKINQLVGFSKADKMVVKMGEMIDSTLNNCSLKHRIYNIRTSLYIILIEEVNNYNEVINWSKLAIKALLEPISVSETYSTSIDVRMGIINIEADKIERLNADYIYDCSIIALERTRNSKLTRCIVYNSDFGLMLSREQIMEDDLRIAIDKDEFVMFFQPQYNTKYNKIVGFEALVRWNNPKYISESVEHYINLAEKNGMIIELGRMIIDKTFSFCKSISDTDIHVSMNVSPAQLLYSGFVNELIESFNRFGLKKGQVAIEITETFLMENSDLMINKIKLLRDNGFSIHLDDFGMGYSSLLYLKDLPVDLIKIDKEFTRNLLIDKYSKVIVSKIIQICLNLDVEIIAEGVETEKQRDTLSKMGCEIIQGYLISKPINCEKAHALIGKTPE